MDLASVIRDVRVDKNEIAVLWLGQAGFLLKDEDGRQLVVDPYLTDCGERKKGFKRISPKLLSPTDLEPDYYLITHAHFDHLDYDAVPIVASCPKTIFCGPASCIEQLRKDEISEERCMTVKPGDKVLLDGIKVTVVEADHGIMAPDAVGYVVEMGGHTIYFTGDTCYHEDYNREVAKLEPDIAMLCINGKFGNMNAEEGARTALEIGVKVAIPCHFWTFIEHGGNPRRFVEYINEHDAGCRPMCMRHGEMVIL